MSTPCLDVVVDNAWFQAHPVRPDVGTVKVNTDPAVVLVPRLDEFVVAALDAYATFIADARANIVALERYETLDHDLNEKTLFDRILRRAPEARRGGVGAAAARSRFPSPSLGPTVAASRLRCTARRLSPRRSAPTRSSSPPTPQPRVILGEIILTFDARDVAFVVERRISGESEAPLREGHPYR